MLSRLLIRYLIHLIVSTLKMNSWLLSHQQILSNQFSKKSLPHAILISGVTGAGKLDLAQWLLHLLTCQQPQLGHHPQSKSLQGCGYCKSCLLLNSNTYPDHLNLIAEKNSLGVDDIRHANSFLQKTAYLGTFKTVLIDNAQNMTQAAANALLKTLEEPSANSIIILLTNDIENLLPTIVSRCRVLNIRPQVGQALLQGMSTQALNIDPDNVNKINFVNLTQLPELTDKGTYESFQSFKRCYLSYLQGQKFEVQLLQLLLGNKHAMRWLEQITVNLFRDQFIGVNNVADKTVIDTELLNKLYKIIINGCRVIKSYTQANKQFVCEQLIMAISDVITQSQSQSQNNEQEN